MFALSASVCDAPACVRTLAEACTRTHACGHACGGVRGETTCLPCLRCGCADEFDDDAAAEVSSGVKFVEETRRGRRISAGDPTKRDAPAPGDENRAPAGGGTGAGHWWWLLVVVWVTGAAAARRQGSPRAVQ